MCRGHILKAVWYVIHWMFGTFVVLLGWYNIFLGLALYIENWLEVDTLKVSIISSTQYELINNCYEAFSRV